jgi:uracil-DNA glycosylase family 4
VDALTRLRRLNEDCAAYFDELYAPDKKVYVFGDGNPCARIALVGEAPGEQETLLGKPFVGRAGRNLDGFLEGTGLHRADLYITNTVKFRPVRLSPSGKTSNRPPTREEVALFLPWLKKELAVVAPDLIVTLGNVPLRALTGKALPIGKVHGQKLEIPGSAPVFALYHPASILYNPALRETYAQDLALLRQALPFARPI